MKTRKIIIVLLATLLLTACLPLGAVNVSAVNFDLTELNKQIAIAESLTETDFTDYSWAILKDCLRNAKNARYSDSQGEINKAAADLKQSIADLVRMDVAALRELLKMVRAYQSEHELTTVELQEDIAEAEAALISGDQDRVNAAYNDLKHSFDDFKEMIRSTSKTATRYTSVASTSSSIVSTTTATPKTTTVTTKKTTAVASTTTAETTTTTESVAALDTSDTTTTVTAADTTTADITTTTSAATAQTETKVERDGDTNNGLILALGVGIGILLAAVAVLLFLLLKKKKSE